MNLKKLIFCAVCAAIPAAVISAAWGFSGASRVLQDQELPAYDNNASVVAIEAENLIRAGMPYRKELAKLGSSLVSQPQIRYAADETGIFLSPNGLMKNIDPPVEEYVDKNIKGIAEFADKARQNRQQTYVALIPTASAIMQSNLPPYAGSVMVNQRQFIEDVNSRLSASATSVDAYSALWQRRNQYIYYRTEDNLASLGGYWVYSAMLSRMGLGQANLGQFDIEYANNAFYGDLYRGTGYRDVVPDSVSLFRYSRGNRVPHELLVTKTDGGSYKIYHTLFPKSAAQLGGELDVFLGGMSAVTDIQVSSQYSSRLLVFGDKTALAYLPFIANNVQRVTLVDLSRDAGGFSSVNTEDYDKVLFAYGVESFMRTDIPSRASSLLE